YPILSLSTDSAKEPKMILRIRPPTVRPTSWKRSRSPLFFRMSKSEKKVSTASSNDTPCTASLSLSKSYSKSAGSSSFHFTTDPFYATRGLLGSMGSGPKSKDTTGCCASEVISARPSETRSRFAPLRFRIQSCMPRPLRLEYRGALHHVTNRGVERRDIFTDDRDRLCFLGLLERVIGDMKWA